MRNVLLNNFTKRPLLLSVVATFAAGCATTEPVVQYPTGARGATGPMAAAEQQPAVLLASPRTPADATSRTLRSDVFPPSTDEAPLAPSIAAYFDQKEANTPQLKGAAADELVFAGFEEEEGWRMSPVQVTYFEAREAAVITEAKGRLRAEDGRWSPYRDYTFNGGSDDIVDSDSNKAREIANYTDQNPSSRVAIDGFNERRVSRVRVALIDAGVPASRIQTGAFGDAQLRRDNRVAVLISN
jgi:outer membrane protein OmpA-like peptidoglycan-associated protein